MTPYVLQHVSRMCAATGRELKSGERYVSLLIEEKGVWTRKDYARDAWPGPPPDSIAYWSGIVPKPGKEGKLVFDDDLLWECFEHLPEEGDESKLQFRYVLALLLMRRRRLRFDDIIKQGADEFLELREAKTNRRFLVRDPQLDEASIQTVQDEIFRLLGRPG